MFACLVIGAIGIARALAAHKRVTALLLPLNRNIGVQKRAAVPIAELKLITEKGNASKKK